METTVSITGVAHVCVVTVCAQDGQFRAGCAAKPGVGEVQQGQTALLSQPTPDSWQDKCPWPVLPRAVEASTNHPVHPPQGFSWTMKHRRALVGSGWSLKEDPDRTTSF